MSALRISRPGQPTQLVVLEPAVGRITHTRGAVYGGVHVVGTPMRRTVSQQQAMAALEASRAAGRRYYANHRDEVRAKQDARRGK